MPYSDPIKQAEYHRRYAQLNKDRIRKYKKENRERINETFRAWAKRNPDKRQKWCSDYIKRHPEKTSEYFQNYHKKHPEKRAAYRKANPQIGRDATRKWKHANRERVNAYRRQYTKKRISVDPNYLIRCRIRTRLNNAIRRGCARKSCPSLQLLGCSVPSFRIYIESKFEEGMTWENYGNGMDKWNFDHIMPLAIFDLTKIEHQKRCFHFSNYQPMWQPDNIRKRDSVGSDQFNLL